MTHYGVDSRSYLARAKAEANSGSAARLFYAAFELRAGIEARLKEYLEHADDIPSGKKRDWQIAKLGLSVTKAFTLDQVARIQIRNTASGPVVATYFYTPVSTELQKLGMKLGDYLHAGSYYRLEDAWWGQFRTSVEVGCHLLEEATAGTLLGPPLMNRKTGETSMPMELPPGITPDLVPIRKGGNYIIEVSYHSSLADARGDAA